MDAAHFDAFARTLSTTGSRRRALSGTLAGVLSTLGVAGTDAKKKKCPPCKKRKQGKCKGSLPDGTACTGGTCQGGSCMLSTCSDGIKNGSESDIDCGGSCQPCATGQGCLTRNDCASAYCVGTTCQACTAPGDCGSSGIACSCISTASGNICTQDKGKTASSCGACPSGTVGCVPIAGGFRCIEHCGAP